MGPPTMIFLRLSMSAPQNCRTSITGVPTGTSTFMGLETASPSTVTVLDTRGMPVTTYCWSLISVETLRISTP